MDYVVRVFNAIEYIEQLLPNTADLKDIAKKANMSPYHFHKVFTSITGETVGKYCQKRRLTLAAERLTSSNCKILDIALEHGYDSQGTFGRAFKDFYGVTPSEFRKNTKDVPIICTKPLSIPDLKHRSKLSKNPEIVKKEKLYLVGLERIVCVKTANSIQLWEEFFLREDEINFVAEQKSYYGVTQHVKINKTTEKTPFTKFCGVNVNRIAEVPDGLIGKIIPENKYAIFTHRGPYETINKSYYYIYCIWLPKTSHQPNLSEDIELIFDAKTDLNSEDTEIKICVPLL